eukprot:5615331-Amphidinium_carterae.1
MAGSPSDLRINLLWPSSCKNSTTESVVSFSPPLCGKATAPTLRVLKSKSTTMVILSPSSSAPALK